MLDPRETLTRIRAQADAATEGPWELLGDGEYVSGPGILVAPDDGGVTSADAEFIAAARTTVPALLDLADAVLDLADRLDAEAADDFDGVSGTSVSLVKYETAKAIRAALNGETHD